MRCGLRKLGAVALRTRCGERLSGCDRLLCLVALVREPRLPGGLQLRACSCGAVAQGLVFGLQRGDLVAKLLQLRGHRGLRQRRLLAQHVG